MRLRGLAAVLLLLLVPRASGQTYALSAGAKCGDAYECWRLVDIWNRAAWDAVVDETFNLSGVAMATVRWIAGEGNCTRPFCGDQLRQHPDHKQIDPLSHHFVGVTDEHSNVLLAAALGSDALRFEKLRNFTELLRMDGAAGPGPNRNRLQCWKFYIDGARAYTSYSDVCIVDDSASDASLRILGAYGIACAKQQAGIWHPANANFCSDYSVQGNAVWGSAANTGEIQRLGSAGNYEYFLANGFKNRQGGAPVPAESFRPDYYELQFLYDYGVYAGDSEIVRAVGDMLRHVSYSLGERKVPRGLNGHFAVPPATSNFVVDNISQACRPPDCSDSDTRARCRPRECLDQFDTWRSVPATSGLLVTHPTAVAADLKAAIFDEWWNRYGGGSATYSLERPLLLQIAVASNDAADVDIPSFGYKTLAMWAPLWLAYSVTARDAVISKLTSVYEFKGDHFFGAAYYGAYYSPFAQRAVGLATGLLDRTTYVGAGQSLCCLTGARTPNGVELVWRGPGSTTFEILRSDPDGPSPGTFATAGTSNVPHFLDSSVPSDRVVVYQVRATTMSGTVVSNRAPVSTWTFTDDPLVAGLTPVKAVHFTQLRTAINQFRGALDMPPFAFSPLSSFVAAADITQLRTAMTDALLKCGAPPLSSHFFAAGVETINRWNIQEIRNRFR